MALTLLELVSRAGQGEDGGVSRGDVESAWSLRLEPSVATTSNFSSEKRRKRAVKGLEDYIEDLIVRESGGWEVRGPNADEEKLVVKLRKKLGNVRGFSVTDFVALVRPALERASGSLAQEGKAMEDETADAEKERGETVGAENERDQSLRDGEESDEFLLLGLLRRGGPLVGRKLLVTIVNCILGLQFWKGLKVLMSLGLVTSVSHPDLVQKLVECRRADMLAYSFHYVLDLTPSDLMMALKFFLNSKPNASRNAFDVVRQEWRRVGSAAVDFAGKRKEMFVRREKAIAEELKVKRQAERERLSLKDPLAILPAEEDDEVPLYERERRQRDAMLSSNSQTASYALVMALAVDGFDGWETCLHALVASGQDEAILTAILAELETCEAVQLLQYLRKWLDLYSNKLSRMPSPKSTAKQPVHNVPSALQVLQWVNMVLDGQYTKCVLASEFLPELSAIQESVASVVAIDRKLVPLVGVIEHLREMHPLPARPQDSAAHSDYTIEYLDIS